MHKARGWRALWVGKAQVQRSAGGPWPGLLEASATWQAAIEAPASARMPARASRMAREAVSNVERVEVMSPVWRPRRKASSK
jgi:hypothetical protein